MTVNQHKRVGRLQEKGFLDYGADVSWTRIRSYDKRPLACQEVSSNNQRGFKTVHKSLAHSMRITGRTNVGYQYDKTQSIRRVPNILFLVSQDDCISTDILASKQEEFRI